MSYFIIYHKVLIIFLLIIISASIIYSDIKSSKLKGEPISNLNFTLGFFCIILFILAFVKDDVVSTSFNDYFNIVNKSKNYVKDKGILASQFYDTIEGREIINRENMTLTIIDDKKLKIDINHIAKNYLSNKDSKDPDLNMCESITKNVEKHNGLIVDPSSCLSNGSMEIIFNVKQG